MSCQSSNTRAELTVRHPLLKVKCLEDDPLLQSSGNCSITRAVGDDLPWCRLQILRPDDCYEYEYRYHAAVVVVLASSARGTAGTSTSTRTVL